MRAKGAFLPRGAGRGDVDACKGCMHTSVLLLDFNLEVLDIFKDKNHQIQL